MTTTRLMTAEELLKMPDDGRRYELIAGELREVAPAGDEHGSLVTILTALLYDHVRTNRLGVVRAGEPGYQLARDPDTVRGADVAFISRERVQATGVVPGYHEGAPDLVVKVISPHDLYTDVEDKVAMWLHYGSRMVIVVKPTPPDGQGLPRAD